MNRRSPLNNLYVPERAGRSSQHHYLVHMEHIDNYHRRKLMELHGKNLYSFTLIILIRYFSGTEKATLHHQTTQMSYRDSLFTHAICIPSKAAIAAG